MRDADPGRIRLKQAVRTTLSALVTVCTLSLIGRYWPFLWGMTPILMGAMSATMVSQILNGETPLQQQASIFLAGFSGIVMVLLTWAVRDVPLLNALTMSLMAFAVFYIRRFGLLYVGLGLYSLFIYVFGTIVAKTEVSPWPGAVAIFFSILPTYIINCYFLPENRRILFRDHICVFMDQAGRLVAMLNSAVSGRMSSTELDRQTHDALKELQKCLARSEATLSGIDPDNISERAFLERIYVNEYRIYGALSLTIDAVTEHMERNGVSKGPLREEMEKAFQLLEAVLSTAKEKHSKTHVFRSQLEQYRCLVKGLRSELISVGNIRKGGTLFLVWVLLAMDRVGRSIRELHDDLMRFDEKAFG